MQLHNIKPKNKLRKSKRVARGGKRGGYSGRGIKGQKSRAGAKIRPAIRDLMMKFPKARGRAKHAFKSIVAKPAILNLKDIENNFQNGEIVSPNVLFEKSLVGRPKKGKLKVKILSEGEISKKLSFQNVSLSKAARDKIEKAGGSIK
ncbi:uL15 family ribosomal protein [Candidatus Azambacteria bacterium]|nr:uL15 family ribosomal protein [Candidatus Azambacteria bacterium]